MPKAGSKKSVQKISLAKKLSSRTQALAFVAIFAVIGTVYVLASHAGTAGGNIVGLGGKCLATSDVNGATQVVLSRCTTGANQTWTWTGDRTIRQGSLCLDGQGSHTDQGNPAILYTCRTDSSQQLMITKSAGLQSFASNMCLDVRGANTADGAVVQFWPCSGNAAQKWNISAAVITMPLTAPAAHASLPAGAHHNSTPTITLDYSRAPEFGPYMEKVLKPLLLQWYPRLADYYAYPYYTPSNHFTIVADPTYDGYAETGGNVITFQPTVLHADLAHAPGLFVHEATHVVQGAVDGGNHNYPSWLAEGLADYTREHVFDDRAPRAALPTETYLNGYSPAANVLAYAGYNAVHTLNTYAYANKYSDGLWTTLTGKTIGQLWHATTGQHVTDPAPITNHVSGKCIDDPFYDRTNGTRLKIQTCNGSVGEKFVFASVNANPNTGVIKLAGAAPNGQKCLDVRSSGTAIGTPVQIWDCNYSAAQYWTLQSNGQLYNAASGKCLDTVNLSNADGTLLDIWTCSSSPYDLWTVAPLR